MRVFLVFSLLLMSEIVSATCVHGLRNNPFVCVSHDFPNHTSCGGPTGSTGLLCHMITFENTIWDDDFQRSITSTHAGIGGVGTGITTSHDSGSGHNPGDTICISDGACFVNTSCDDDSCEYQAADGNDDIDNITCITDCIDASTPEEDDTNGDNDSGSTDGGGDTGDGGTSVVIVTDVDPSGSGGNTSGSSDDNTGDDDTSNTSGSGSSSGSSGGGTSGSDDSGSGSTSGSTGSVGDTSSGSSGDSDSGNTNGNTDADIGVGYEREDDYAFCDDGLPSGILGFPGCDRPAIQYCNGVYKLASDACLSTDGIVGDPFDDSDIDVTTDNDIDQLIEANVDIANFISTGNTANSNAIIQSNINAGDNVAGAITRVVANLDKNNELDTDRLIDAINAIDINVNASGVGQCDPTSTNYYDCLGSRMSSFPSHTTSTNSSFTESNVSFKNRLDNTSVVLAFSGMTNLVSFESASCPAFSIDLTETIIGVVASTTLHCELMLTISPIISTVMSIVYVFVGFRIFASA